MKFKTIQIDKTNLEIDWERIGLFRKRFEILWDNLKDIKLGNLSINVQRSKDGHYSGTSTLPNIHRLKGLYADYRHFYLKKEATNIFGFMNYLCKIADSNEYNLFIKSQKGKFKSSFIENKWFKVNNKKITTDVILDLSFNAEIFHSDPNKFPQLEEIKEYFDENLWKTLIFRAVYDTSLIIRNIHWSQSELSKEHMFLLIPL